MLGDHAAASYSYNPATSQGYCADANGNANEVSCGGFYYGNTYDIENRIVQTGTGDGPYFYSYAPGNKRVWRGNGGTVDELTFWSPSGQKLGTYGLTTTPGTSSGGVNYGPYFYATQTGTNYYFGSKLIKNAGGWVYSDRLGSIGKFYPYGQERPSPTTNGTEKFTGYFRDAETGNDYAINRYQQPGTGRFLTTDPARSSNPGDSSSWNQYAYSGGDPINRTDPDGLLVENICGVDSTAFGCEPFAGYWEQLGLCGTTWGGYFIDCSSGGGGGGGSSGGGGGGGGVAAGDPNCSRIDWLPAQEFVYSTIMGDINALGLDVGAFSVVGVQMAGGSNVLNPGVVADQTELVLQGDQVALTSLEASMCGISGQSTGYNANTPNCFAVAGFDPAHAGSPGTQINFRQDTATYSMQVSGSVQAGVWTLDIDIDPNNPSAGMGGKFKHFGNFIWNHVTGGDTNYGNVAAALGKRGVRGACP